MCYLILFFLLAFLSFSYSLNVLVYAPVLGYSHAQFMGNIADILAEDGHNVTMILVEYDKDVKSNGTKKANKIIPYSSSKLKAEEYKQLHFKKSDVFSLNSFKFSDVFLLGDMQHRMCETMLEDKMFIENMRKFNFHIVVAELFHLCPVGLFHLMGIPKIAIASALGITSTHYLFLDMPIWLSNTPAFSTDFRSQMSFFERLQNIVIHGVGEFFIGYTSIVEQSLFRRFYPDFPDLIELGKRMTDYVLLNSNEITESTRTILHSVRHVGGATIYDVSPLPKHLEDILINAKEGVVLFSMGSLIRSSSCPHWFKKIMLEAFQEFPDFTFLWKDEEANISSSGNIHFRPWMPQVDLLADKRVKAFISHAGPNSVIESSYFGVPMMLIPIFWDQNWHATVAEERGFAIKLDKFNLSKELVISALRTILYNNSHRKQAELASQTLHGSPLLMRNEIRRVIRLSGKTKTQLTHLRLASELPLFQYYNFDVYLFFIGLVFLVVFIIALSVRLCCRKVTERYKKLQ